MNRIPARCPAALMGIALSLLSAAAGMGWAGITLTALGCFAALLTVRPGRVPAVTLTAAAAMAHLGVDPRPPVWLVLATVVALAVFLSVAEAADTGVASWPTMRHRSMLRVQARALVVALAASCGILAISTVSWSGAIADAMAYLGIVAIGLLLVLLAGPELTPALRRSRNRRNRRAETP